mgnify:CR=1 FL=1
MTKHLRFLFVMLLAMIWSAGWAQTTVFHETFDKCTSTGGNDGAWAASSGSNQEINSSTLISNNLDNVWTGLKKIYPANKCVKVATGDIAGTMTTPTINSTGDFTIKIKAGACSKKSNVQLTVKTTTGTLDKSSVSLTAGEFNEYSIELSGVTKAFTLTFTVPKSKQSFIDDVEVINKASADTKKDPGISFGETTYTANITDKDDTYHSYVTLNNPNNLLVTYASSKTDVAEVNAAGEVKVLGLGTTTISATFAGDDTYKNATVSYELTVVDPNVKVVVFKVNVQKGNKTSLGHDNISNEGVNIDAEKSALGRDDEYRIYDEALVTFSVTTGTITKIVFEGNSTKYGMDKLSSDGYTYESDKLSGTWIGEAKTVTFKNTSGAQARVKTITVYVSLPSEITLNETAPNTIEAKTGVNVTLNRPMNVGRWNTFCVPFSIDAKQIASQFGEGTQIAAYSVSVDNEIDFATVQSNAIVAGKAYLVKPTKEAATEGYTFSNVNITALVPTKETVDDGAIDFRGIYNPTDITVGLPDNTFAAGIVGNVVKKAVSGSNMKGFRAFFIIPEGTGAQSSYMLKIDGTATSINSINGADVVVNAPVYNLQGQRVDGNNLTPGIYVKAGKKFVVK